MQNIQERLSVETFVLRYPTCDSLQNLVKTVCFFAYFSFCHVNCNIHFNYSYCLFSLRGNVKPGWVEQIDSCDLKNLPDDKPKETFRS